MTAQEININRDREHDILYVIKSNLDQGTITNIPVSADVVLRLHQRNKEIVGFIIDDFSITFPVWKDWKDYQLMEEFDRILKVLNDEAARQLTTQAAQAV